MKAKTVRWIVGVQGVHYILTGLWPILHAPSFEAVMGPRPDWWTVKMFGALTAALGLVLVDAWRRAVIRHECVLFSIVGALVFAVSDAVLIIEKTAGLIYLTDLFVNAIVLASWVLVRVVWLETPREPIRSRSDWKIS